MTAAGTRAGDLLGTPAYMSPEQARGQIVDRRTDLWAFGCVLYEMLTGRSAFSRGTATDTAAAILERDPDWRALPGDTPSSIRTLLKRCLEKDKRQRVAAIDVVPADLFQRRATWGSIVVRGSAALRGGGGRRHSRRHLTGPTDATG